MIYLIQSAGYDDSGNFIHILKIGFTEDSTSNNRFTAYRNHNPTNKVLYKIPGGTSQDELNLHNYFRKFRKFGNEWYEYVPDIIEFFRTHTTANSLSILPTFKAKKEKKLERQEEKERIKNLEQSLSKEEGEIYQAMSELNSYSKLKYLCELMSSGKNIFNLIPLAFQTHTEKFIKYFKVIGPIRIKALGYNIIKLNNELELAAFDPKELDRLICSEFSVGEIISLRNIKFKLKNIYSKCNYTRAPKATDLEDYFEIKEVYLMELVDGKRKKSRGYEILSKKH